jgi:glycosyltransferase involved in cell wall biosynthesis
MNDTADVQLPLLPRSVAIYMHDLSSGGVERLTLTLADEFSRFGIRTTLLLHARRGDFLDQVPEGVEVVAFGTWREIADLPPLMSFLRRARPDVLLSSLNHNNIIAVWARLLARVPTRVVVSVHNTLSEEVAALGGWKYRAMPTLYRRFLPLADSVVAVSQGVAEDLSKVARVQLGRISVIHNPILHRNFDALAAEPVPHRWLQPGAPRPVFVSVGRLVEQKDFSTLLRAFSLYRRAHPGRLVVLGRGPLLEQLQAEAAQLGIQDDVDFAGFSPNPLPYLYAADLFVLSSRYEGFGNVLVEALGCGTPVLSTDCPHGPREILEDGAHGRLVPVGDAAALAAGMEQRGAGPWTPETLRARARAFSSDVIARRYLEIFAEAGGTA